MPCINRLNAVIEKKFFHRRWTGVALATGCKENYDQEQLECSKSFHHSSCEVGIMVDSLLVVRLTHRISNGQQGGYTFLVEPVAFCAGFS